jgi:tetratricopeptide (TPR) repeat protein
MVNIAELQDELERVLTTSPREATAAAGVLERAVTACRADPEARDWFDLAGLLDELAEVYQQLGRVEDALEAMRAAIEAGYAGRPDPRCRLAEIMLRAGRTESAHEVYAQVKTATPDDVWLYNSAGLEYGAAGDHPRALHWLSAGLEIALDTGDPENLVGQLAELRREQLTVLGYQLDDLDTRAKKFLDQPQPRRRDWSPTELPALLDVLDTANSSPLTATALGPSPTCPPTRSHSQIALAVSWFPATEFAEALRTWPHLAEDWDSPDYTHYNHRLERHLHNLSAADPTYLWIAPIHLDAFQRWCHTTGRDPATSTARAGYAADRARSAAPELIPWPPPRNAPCWCGTGRKYKKCCGHPSIGHTTQN